jgi:hypothetical protein
VSLVTPSVPGSAATAPLFLWSTNTFLKYRIQQTFQNGKHYAWCSPTFEGAALQRYAIGTGQAASSDPATIYRQLYHAVVTKDQADGKITSQKKVLRALAVNWSRAGSITEDDRDEIIAILRKSEVADWRPLIYVIPYAVVATRVKLVPRPLRATLEPEYVVPDLSGEEFHIIEPYPCS